MDKSAGEPVKDWNEAVKLGANPRASADAAWKPAESEGSQALRAVYDFLGRFVSYPSDEARVAHTLWVAHTHLMDAWESTPRLAFLSPEPGSGKTRALEVTALLVPLPIESVNVSPAYLFRKVGSEEGRPTILFDEIDTVFGPKAKENEEVRGLLNAGHRRGAVAGRCVVKNKVVETEEIPAYCAVALAGLGGLPDTISSRSILVNMRRRSPEERVEPFRARQHGPEGEAINRRLTAWAQSVLESVTGAWPKMPPGITDRAADVWEPLLAAADAAGGAWPDLARVAAVTFVTLQRETVPSLGVMLLRDIRQIFGQEAQRSTALLLEGLNALVESPWADIRGKQLDDRRLARRLKEFGIKPKVLRVGETTMRGYTREDFEDAWRRYLSPPQA